MKLCYVMLCYVILCHVMLCYVMLCYVMLCYVMLCYVMLCMSVCLSVCMYVCMHGWMDGWMFLGRSLSEVWSWGVPLPHWSQNAHRPPEISIELSVRCTGSWLMMVHFTCRLRACHEAMLQAGSQRESPC